MQGVSTNPRIRIDPLYKEAVRHGHHSNSTPTQKTESRPITKNEKEKLTEFFKVHKAATNLMSEMSHWFESSDSNIKENLESIDHFKKDLIDIKSASNLRTGAIDNYIKILKDNKTSFTTKTSLPDYKEQLLSGQKAQIETIKTELSVSENSRHSYDYPESFKEIYKLSSQSSDLKSAITEKLNSIEESLRNTKYDRPEEIDTLLKLSVLDVSNEKISIYLDGGNKTFTIKEALNKIKTNDLKIGQLKIKEKINTDKNKSQGYEKAFNLLLSNKKSINTEINKLLNKPNLPPDIKEKLTEISEELNPQSKPKSMPAEQNPWGIFNIFTKQEEPDTAPIKAVSPGYNDAVHIKYSLDKLDNSISKSNTPKQNETSVNNTTKHIQSLINKLEKEIDLSETLSQASTVSRASSTASKRSGSARSNLNPPIFSRPSSTSAPTQHSSSSNSNTTASSKNLPKSPPPQSTKDIDIFGLQLSELLKISPETQTNKSSSTKNFFSEPRTQKSTSENKNPHKDFFGNLVKTTEDVFNALNPLTILGNFSQEKPPQNNPRQNLGSLSQSTNNQKQKSHTPSNLNKPFIQINKPSNVRPKANSYRR